MFDSGILDVAIGLAVLYLLLSLICSAITEGIAQLIALRSGNLRAGIRNLLNDPEGNGLTNTFYYHPLVRGLYSRGRFDTLINRDGKPSYIPPRIFALALFDILAPDDPETGPKSFAEVRNAVANLSNERLRKVLLLCLDNADEHDLKEARANVEEWFNDAMDRVSGWYKRKTQLIILMVAVGISLVLNADTFNVARNLWDDAALRESVVAAAQQVSEQPLPDNIAQVRQELAQLQLPLGWQSPPCWWYSLASCDLVGGLTRTLGLLFTVVALSLGAPFWFDLLSKFIDFRSTGERESPRT